MVILFLSCDGFVFVHADRDSSKPGSGCLGSRSGERRPRAITTTGEELFFASASGRRKVAI